MPRILLLPPEIVNRIAAGEVIERPASVVKELVENSIDAGATEVLIEVEDGGRRRIRVHDNGAGMSAEDLPLAFRSHATSKLALEGAAEGQDGPLDLFSISTLGFRGEALASIASVAEVEAVSRPPEADCAHRLRLYGGGSAGDGPEPVAGPAGTSIEVRSLFFNTPARRKFLRGGSTELSHILDQVVRLALGFSGIRFSLSSEGKRVLDCPPAATLRERLAAVIGRERASQLIEVREPAGGPSELTVRGFVGPPHVHRPDARGQHFFVDGRWVRDRVLSHALQEAYRGFQIPGQRPLAYLFVDVPPGQVDVNVHPTKCEVRFLDSGAVHRIAHRSVREALERSGAPRGTGGEPVGGGPLGVPGAAEVGERVRAATLDFLSGPRPFLSDPRPPERWPAGIPGYGREREREREGEAAAINMSPRERSEPAEPGAVVAQSPAGPVQILRSYILVELEEGIVLHDQHALHEKVLYERLVAQLRAGPMPRQKLLIPEVVDLPVELAPLLERVAAHLGPLGFEVEAFGPTQAAVHAVPAVLDGALAAPVVLAVAAWLREGAAADPERGAAGPEEAADPLGAELRRVAQMASCKRAVKAGTALSAGEMESLLESARLAADPRFCPHGRPTSIFLSRSELERRFQRR